MKNLGYYNGRIGLIEEMTIPMSDRACIRRQGIRRDLQPQLKIYTLYEHLDRFTAVPGCSALSFRKKRGARRASVRMVKNDTGEQLVYWQVTRDRM